MSKQAKQNRPVPGHRRVFWEHNGERIREESAWTWECSCGATESGSTKAIAEEEWRFHKTDMRKQNDEL